MHSNSNDSDESLCYLVPYCHCHEQTPTAAALQKVLSSIPSAFCGPALCSTPSPESEDLKNAGASRPIREFPLCLPTEE